MKIKISDRFIGAISPNHIRQWCKTLLDYTSAVYVPENSPEWADIGIDTKNNVGKSVFIDLSDPWSLVNTIPVDELAVPELVALLQVPYTPPSVAFANGWDRGVEFYDSYDFYCPVVCMEDAERHIKPLLKHAKFLPLPHSLPEDVFFNSDTPRTQEVFFSGAMDVKWYPLRNMMWQALQRDGSIQYSYLPVCGNVAKLEVEKEFQTLEQKIEAFDRQLLFHADNLRKSKITMFDGTIFNIPVKKYIEAMACGCLVLAPLPKDAELMGFVDGETMVEITADNFMEKARWYLEHEEERNRITANASQLCSRQHTLTKSVEQFMKGIQS